MNDFHKTNLVRHRDWLVANADEIVGFDMGTYGHTLDGVPTAIVADCGSPGCVLGWTARSMPELTHPTRFFLDVARDVFGAPTFSHEGNYLFSARWADTGADNTLDGAIARLTAFIDNDFTVPADAVMP